MSALTISSILIIVCSRWNSNLPYKFMCLQAIGETWFVPKNEIVKPIDAPSVDILLSTLVLIAEAMVGTSITLLIKGTVISGDLIPAKVYLQTLKDNLKNSHQEIQVPDEIYKSFDLVFETFEKSLPKNAEEALNKQIGVLHLKNVQFKNDDVWSNEPSDVIRVKLNSVDGFIWGRVK